MNLLFTLLHKMHSHLNFKSFRYKKEYIFLKIVCIPLLFILILTWVELLFDFFGLIIVIDHFLLSINSESPHH
jgi:hypothetical protein